MSKRSRAIVLFILFFCLFSIPAYSTDPSLVIHYTFDTNPGSTAVDLSQYGNDGAITDCNWLSSYGGRSGIMRFNDTTSSINCGNDNSLYFDGDMTVEMWVRWNRQILNQSANIFGETQSTFRFGQNYIHSLMLWYNCEYDHTQTMRVAVDNNLIENYRNDTGGWSHVAMVVEYPRCRFYKNGELFYDAYMPAIGILKNVQRNKYIGKGLYGGDPAPIDLDEFRWYKRALPAIEIAGHAAGQNPDPNQSDEIFNEVDYYNRTVTARLSSKGYDYSGYTAKMTLTTGTPVTATVPVSIEEAFDGCGRYVASHAFDFPFDPNGTRLKAEVKIYDANDVWVKTRAKTITFRAPDWIDVNEGYTATVPEPWTDLVAQQNLDGTVDVNTWGRSYKFGGTPFLTSVKTQGTEILASPIRFRAKAGTTEYQWNTPTTTLTQFSDMDATVTQSFCSTNNMLQVDINSVVEYDGYILFDVRIEALAAITNPNLSFIVLEIPLKTDYATLCLAQNVYPYDPNFPMGCRFSGAITQTENFGFSPDIWIGNEEVGLTYQAESDEDWRPDVSGAIAVGPNYPTTGKTSLSLKFINLQTAVTQGTVYHYQFALMATPVKPLLRESLDLRIARSNPYGEDLSLPDRVEADSQPTLDHYVDLGVRDLFINTATIYPWPMPTAQVFSDALDDLVAASHAKGIRLHQYMIHQRMPIVVPEWDIYGRQMSNLPFKTYTPGGVPEDANGDPLPPYDYHGPVATNYGANSQGTVFFCPKSKALQDAYINSLADRLDRYSDDGIYLDGTGSIVLCENTEHGCGRTKDNVFQGTWPTFSAREFMRRIYNVVKTRNPDGVVDLHMSFNSNSAALAYADVLWTGEQWHHLIGTGAPNGYISGELPLDVFRAEFMGRQIGVATEVLDYRLGDPYKISAISLLHDIPVRVLTDSDFIDTMSAIWKARDEFEVNDVNVTKLYYWNNSSYVTVSPDKCYATLIKHPQNGVLAVISNLDPNAQTLVVDFNLPALGLTACFHTANDVVTGRKITIEPSGRMVAALDTEEFLYIWIHPDTEPSMTAVFNDDFEDDMDYDDGPYTDAGAFQNGPPANEGKSGRWLPGQWNIDSRFPDQNWNINVVKDSTYTYYWGDPVAKYGKELYYLIRNLQNFGDGDDELYDGFNRDAFGKFTDSDGNPIVATEGQTIWGTFKVCRLAQMPAFALTTDVNALADATASESTVTDIYGAYAYPYSSLQHYMADSEKWDPNVACIIAMGQGTASKYWFNAIVPKFPANLSGGVTAVALDSQNTGVSPYLAIANNTDRQNDKPYHTIYFEYVVGDPNFAVFQVDGNDIHTWANVNGVYVETTNDVPFGNYLGAADNGIDGLVLGHTRHESNGYHAFYDDFQIGILNE